MRASYLLIILFAVLFSQSSCVTATYQQHKLVQNASFFLNCPKDKVRIRRTDKYTYDAFGCGRLTRLNSFECRVGAIKDNCVISSPNIRKSNKRTLAYGWTVTKKDEEGGIHKDTQVLIFRADGNPIPTPKDPPLNP